MLHVPGYAVGAPLGHAEPARMFGGTAELDGHAVVLRRSTASGVVARDALRSAVARAAGVRSVHLIVPSTVVTAVEGLVVVYDVTIAAVWDGVANFQDPAAAALAVVAAVADLHEAGLAHGALVPEAVWLDAAGRARLACLPGPEEADMSADRKNLSRFVARIAVGHPQLGEAVAAAGDSPAPRDLLSRLAPFTGPVVGPAVMPGPVAVAAAVVARPADAVTSPVLSPVPPVVAQRPPAAIPTTRDVLRAPRPNRPISGPPAPKQGFLGRLSRPAVVALVGVAVLLGAAGVGVAAAQLSRQSPSTLPPLATTSSPSATPSPALTPRPTPTTRPSSPPAVPTPSTGPTASGDAPWVHVMTQLDEVRDAAFIAADASQLDRVYVEGSAAAAEERAAMSKLRDAGMHADGLRLTVHDVRLVKKSGAHVTLRVVDDLPSYRLVGERGDTISTEPARGAVTWHITLDKVAGGWRIASIERAAV